MAERAIRVGLLGLGTVGGGVAQMLVSERERLRRRLGTDLVLAKAVDLDPSRAAELELGPDVFSQDPQAVLGDPSIDIVVELIGGLEPARALVLSAIAAGKHVATANKALLASHGAEIFAAAAAKRVSVAFEASVGGGIPLIRSLREGLAANRVTSLMGILNGTCNYILSRMTSEGASFAEMLKDAQALGYAEADPSFDVQGKDTAHKLAIVSALATGVLPDLGSIPCEGITGITPLDIQFAGEFGYKIKLLAIMRRQEDDQVQVRVHPALVARDHLLASVDGPFNAVHIVGDWVGPILLYGQGAGRRPTASAVVGDLIDLGRDILCGCACRVPPLTSALARPGHVRVAPLKDAVCQYYFRFTAQDQPGVLAAVSRVLADWSISIQAVIQKGREDQGPVPIVMLTHEAREENVQQALKVIDDLQVIAQPTMVIRVA